MVEKPVADPAVESAQRHDDPSDTAAQMRDVVERFVCELQPHRQGRLVVRLDTDLERELGLDSLARTELLARVEQSLGVSLPSSLLADAETVRDILAAVLGREHASAALSVPATPSAQESAEAPPPGLQTLSETLAWRAKTTPDRTHVILRSDSGSEHPLTYQELQTKANTLAAGLIAHGFEPGDRAALMLPTSEDFFVAFAGVLAAGGVPVPIYPPMRRSQLEAHLRRQAVILRSAGVTAMITVDEAKSISRLVATQVETLRHIETVQGLSTAGEAIAPVPSGAESLAMLQYTSGSTGDPKGVMLTHANLLANIRAMGEAAQATSSDRLVSWLPLYHDMGLIGAWLACLYFAIPTVIMSPLTFLTRPSRWLWAMHQHRATVSPSPNFGYELCVRRFDPSEYEGLDLSCVRMLLNGAEGVSSATIQRFTEAFAPFGLRPEAMAPVYGLAENAVALSFPPPGRAPIVDRVVRAELAASGVATKAPPQDEHAQLIVACGRPLPGHELRIVDEAGHELADRHEGRIQFCGPSSTSGYFGEEEKTRALFDGTWVETGDRGYVAAGDVYITGRSKDMIIRAGRNIFPVELEEAVGDLDGVRKGCVVVFGARDHDAGTERLVVVAETRETDPDARERISAAIVELTTDLLDGPPDEALLVPPQTVLKTSSGKVRRAATRSAYERGELLTAPSAVWVQLARLSWTGLKAMMRSAARRTTAMLFAAYWWSVMVASLVLIWPLVVGLPRKSWRWSAFRTIARANLWLSGNPVNVESQGAWPQGACIFVCNHASYLDGLVLAATLPGEPVFVAKGELKGNAIARTSLAGIGARFVDRFDARQAEDARGQLEAAIAKGEQLIVFAEGTLTRRPGLAGFRLGAFLVAARTGAPIIPITLVGTRTVMRGDQWFPRRGRITAKIGEPIVPSGTEWEDAIALRDETRAKILADCGEPDLVAEKHPLLDLAR